jgi:radical SAM superfamily enzyme YgiQ (UPF0313 family)
MFLSHAYFLSDDPREQRIMRPYPPLGLLSLAAWLERHGVACTVFDSTFSTPDAQREAILRAQPRVLGLYANLMTKVRLLELVRWVRAQPELARTRVLLGGPDVTHNAEAYLRAGAHLIAVGEGEQTALEVALEAQNDAPDFSRIGGLILPMPDGSTHRTAAREKLRDLDALPFPARHAIDLQRYLDAWKTAHGQSAVSVSTQRGCPYTCKWCSTAVYGQSYRRRSPANVADELEDLQRHYAFDLVWFVDDVFTISHKWLRAFHDVLNARNLTVRYECITRADRMNADVVALLRDSGCFRVWIGAESGSQSVIDAMDRRVDVHQVQRMIRLCREAGIETGTFIMLGYPGETHADVHQTVAHLKAANPDLFTITVAYPIKGTGLYDAVAAQSNAAALDWTATTDRDIDFKRTYPRAYYHYAVRWTVNSVLWHKARLKGAALRPSSLAYALKALVARAGMAVASSLTSA